MQNKTWREITTGGHEEASKAAALLLLSLLPQQQEVRHQQLAQQQDDDHQQELRHEQQQNLSMQGGQLVGRFMLLDDETIKPGAAPTTSAILPHHSGKIVPFFPAFPGALSACCSLLIIYVILRSKQKLSSVYHRIMFFMSIADLLSSLAMAFHTIPMPPHLPNEDEYPEYVFATKRMGNTTTCDIQGFAYLFGIITLFNYNSMLCVYYACAIGFQMDERRIARYVEPVCHFLVVMIALINSIPPLFNELYNPSPTEMWCVVSFYPFDCYEDENVPCIRGNVDSPFLFNIVLSLAIGIGLNFLIVISSFILVIARVVYIDRSVARYGKTCSADMRQKVDNAIAKNRVTKVVVLQASAYIMAFVITNLFPFFNFVTDESPIVTQAMTLVFLPLQGFFNFIIFMGHKVYNYRRVNPNVSRCEVVWKFFSSGTPVEEPMYISQLSRVEIGDQELSEHGGGDPEERDPNDDYDPQVLEQQVVYPMIRIPAQGLEQRRDLSVGGDVFIDENEIKSTFSWVENEDGLFPSSEAGFSSGMSETRSRNTTNSSKNLSYADEE